MATIYVKTTGNDSTGDGSSGNPYLSPGKAASVMAAGDTIDVSAGTYVITSASTNVAGGCINDTRNSSGVINKWIGHGTVIFQAGVGLSSANIFSISGQRIYVENFTVDGNNKSSITGIDLSGSYNRFYKCTAYNCTFGYHSYCTDSDFFGCLARNNGTGGFKTEQGNFFYCVSHDNGGYGGFYSSTNYQQFNNCIAYNNGGWGFGGNYSCLGQIIRHCISYGNVNGGFQNSGWGSGGRAYIFDSCVAYGNSGYGFNGDGTTFCINCAAGSNTSGAFNNVGFQINSISLTVDPFTSASAGNFNLNTTAGGGAALRAATFSMLW